MKLASQSVIPWIKLDRFGTPAMQWLLLAMLGLSLLDGVISGLFEVRHAAEPLWWDILALLSMIVMLLCWYHQDSNLRHFQRHKMLNIVILGAAIIGIPYYLIRSRPKGKKIIAIGWLLTYTGLFFLSSACGTRLAQLFA